jgi:hypothetical protein
MSAGDCQRWMALTDHAAAGEDLPEKDQVWLAQHARTCDDCARETHFYSSLRDALGRPEMLVVPPHAARPTNRHASARRALLVGLALAACVAFAVEMPRYLRNRRSPSPVPPSPVTAQVLFASGEVHLGPAMAGAGQRVPQGERFSTVCLDGASAATLALTDPSQVVVYLDRGRLMVRLDRQPAGRIFLVRTAQAEVQAVGTRFSVGVAGDGKTLVRLHEGKIAVRAANHVSSDLAAPAQADVSDDIRVTPMPAGARGEDQLLSDLSALSRTEKGAEVLLNSSPRGADVTVDSTAMGKTPLSLFVDTSAHVRLSLPGYEPVSDWIDVTDGRPIERTFTLTALPAPPSDSSARATEGRHVAVSPSRLLGTAQALRARGDYDACARIYRRLWSEFPGSEEAKVSMISLGELELGGRRRPAAALEAFSAYLRIGGSLEREARFGRIRALRMLDRDAEADTESDGFLRDYPTSVPAAVLRRHAHDK